MDRRKELKDAYKKEKPPMGVLMLRQKDGSGGVYLSPAKDLKARANRLRFQLGAGGHPHKGLQALWNRLGPDAFEITVLDTLEYPKDDLGQDFGDDLMELCREHLKQFENGEIIA